MLFIKKYYQTIIFVILLSLLCLLQFNNVYFYPVKKGFDARDHIYYIQILQKEHRFPLPNESGQTDHPPLYYMIASIFPSIQFAKLIGLLSWISITICSYLFFKHIFTKQYLIYLGCLIVSSIPAVIYMTPQISNELLSALFISSSLVFYTLNRKKLSNGMLIILGILVGLSVMTKITGLVLFASIVVDLAVHFKFKINESYKKILLFSGVTAIVGGAYYLRNLFTFGNPIIMSHDFPHLSIEQVPGYRDIWFYTDLSSFFKLDLFHAHYYSLFGGTYFSWFYDAHTILVPVQSFSKAGALLVIWSLPLFILFIRGIIKWFHKPEFLILLIYPFLLWLSYLYFTYDMPFYSSVKGNYLISAIIPFGYLIIQNVKNIPQRLIPVLYLYMAIFIILVLKNFWVIPSWYAYLK